MHELKLFGGVALSVTALALLAGLAMSGRTALADDGPPTAVPLQQGGGCPPGPHNPPPEAFEACRGRNQGDACTVNTPHGTLTGTCETFPGQGLVCRPACPPPPAA